MNDSYTNEVALKEIGGYFSLELERLDTELYPGQLEFQSARAAFRALLVEMSPKKIWMPKLLCDVMYAIPYELNIEIRLFDITMGMEVADKICLEENDCLFYVNYFGVCVNQELKLAQEHDKARLIFDHSQALYSTPVKGVSTIFSPRKFLGIPDGGLLVTDLDVDAPTIGDSKHLPRCIHLLKRLEFGAEAGYEDFLQAEKLLSSDEIYGMSKLSQRILYAVDHAVICDKRNSNFEILHAELGGLNRLPFLGREIEGPLCYPLLVENSSLRKYLILHNVFVATYWPSVLPNVDSCSVEHDMASSCIAIPCDQRYDEDDMLYIVNLVQQWRKHDQYNE